MEVRVVIEKDGDEGYTHFNGYVPVELLPNIGEVIEVYYPDGGCNEMARVKSYIKVFGRDKSCYNEENSFHLHMVVDIIKNE